MGGDLPYGAATNSMPRIYSVTPLPRSNSQHSLRPLSFCGSTQSMFGYQVKSQRASTTGFSFSQMETGRMKLPRAKSNDRLKSMPGEVHPGFTLDPVFRGEEHNRHHIPATPNPGKYEPVVHAVGKQVLSNKPRAATCSFDRLDRFYFVNKELRARATPGPGQYQL